MFGSRRDLAMVQARIAELEREVGLLSAQIEAVRPILADAAHLQAVADRVGQLNAATEAALDRLQARAEQLGVARLRLRASLGRVYRAETAGHVAVYYTGGWTDKVELLVGPEDPPTEPVGEANSTNDINSYAGAIVRPGEYWMATSKRGPDRSGFQCVFTPLS